MSVSLALGDVPASTPPQPQPSTQVKPPPQSANIEVEVAEPPPPPLADIAPRYVDAAAPDADDAEAAERDPLSDPVALSVAAAATNASGEVCQLTAWLQQALQADPQVQAALLDIPRPARSVANALMLWDGEWVEPRIDASRSVAAVRAALVAGIRAAPPACQMALVRGPELITLADGSGVTILAVGSGEWRWEHLLRPSRALTVGFPSPPLRQPASQGRLSEYSLQPR